MSTAGVATQGRTAPAARCGCAIGPPVLTVLPIGGIVRAAELVDRDLVDVFSPLERAYCAARARPVEHFAGRLAAKRAALAALRRLGAAGISEADVEIVPDVPRLPVAHAFGLNRRPRVSRLHGSAAEVLAPRQRLLVSITHLPRLAAAVAAVATADPRCEEGWA